MKNPHHSDAEWADFVRDVASGSSRSEMEAHLASGCRRCRRSMEALGTVVAVARGEADREPPMHALRLAMAVFSLRQPERVHILPRVLARLVFDSFGEPAPVGIRSRERVSRQAMYRAGDYYVDLRLESEPGARLVSLVGQVAESGAAHQSVANVPIVLASAGEVLVRTESNEFGEFQMSYEPRRQLRLYVPVRGDRKLEVALGRLAPERKRVKAKTDGSVRARTGRRT